MLADLLTKHEKILAECAIAERLRRQPGIELHPTLYNTPLIYGPEAARRSMVSLYEEYLATAKEAGLPLLLTAPTWRLDPLRVAAAGVPTSINADAVDFLREVRGDRAQPVLVGALLGPKNDCYRPDLAPDSAEAEVFHAIQVNELASTAADFLLAQTLPSVAEALGVARAIASTGLPYILSFCAGADGHVLDGTPLPQAMAFIDEDPVLARPPVGYFVNCTHPRFLLDRYAPGSLPRLIGIQANGSSKDVSKLDGSGATEADPVAEWTRAMLELHEKHAVPILGGCCGTELSHMRGLADLD
ncbi:MAG: homocysteine S-methyltransferase family protein [Verrucomicrobia bacterium]|nr:homocysteine S-methyltransferase family protein [Verrucomicrobiota bacterium]